MTILRIFIHSEDLLKTSWQIFDNLEAVDQGEASLSEAIALTYDQIEIYLAPTLATIIQTEIGSVNDRRINDELLLGLVEDQLAEDMETCKPILLRLNDGIAYIAILSRAFHASLLAQLTDHVKQVKFIQPFPFVTTQEGSIWTIYLIGENKFIRISQYEYYLLDDGRPVPELLEYMLTNYTEESIYLYTDDLKIQEILTSKYKLTVKNCSEYQYGVTVWNFYNEKSKRFNIKLGVSTISSLMTVGKSASIFLAIYLTYWVINFGFLLYERSRLQYTVSQDLKGIVATEKYSDNLLPQVDDKLATLAHSKGIYGKSDMVYLFSEFLKVMPDVNNSMIQGVQYSGSTLSVFLNSQFDAKDFVNDKAVLQLKRIRADVSDYKSYQAEKASNNKANNNGGGVLNDTSSTSSAASAAATLQDAAWVITLQLISRMDRLDDSNSK